MLINSDKEIDGVIGDDEVYLCERNRKAHLEERTTEEVDVPGCPSLLSGVLHSLRKISEPMEAKIFK